MARTSRILLKLVCEKCKSANYITEKNKVNTTEKLAIKKHCRNCRKTTTHKESTRLK
ncbi:MAG: 50S ribosomal protein L33 [Patescibacteria group bacterium]|nr:50S ribosomal protein L33 [Patescibacteria group bacterium]